VTTARRVAVIGAGPAGLAAAHRLCEHGIAVEVFEGGDVVGGLARSESMWGQAVDLGPHIFAGGDQAALALWNRLAGPDAHELVLRRGIVLPDALLEYPVRALDLVRKFASTRLATCVLGLVAARLRPGRDRDAASAEAWATARYGRPLYDALLRHYVEKLWGVPGTAIDAAFARSLFGQAAPRRDMPPVGAPARTFRYPREGASKVWDALAGEIRAAGGELRLRARVDALGVTGGRVDGVVVGGERKPFTHVISTMPVVRLVAMLPDVPEPVRSAAGALRARHVVAVHLLVRGAPRVPYLWVFAYDTNVRVGRLADHRAWHPHLPPDADAVVTMEYWCSDDDPMWTGTDADLFRLAERELHAIGLHHPGQVVDGRIARLRGALPVPLRGYGRALRAVGEHLAGVGGLVTIGRHGSFTSGSMADVMAEGHRAADAVAERC